MACVLSKESSLSVIEGKVLQLIVQSGIVRGVKLSDNTELRSKSVILAAGTALRGTIHVGMKVTGGAGNGDEPINELSEQLFSLGFAGGRLKTGTPPRLRASSVDYSKMLPQYGDNPPPFMSWQARTEYKLFHVEHPRKDSTKKRMFHVEHDVSLLTPWPLNSEQMPCYITHTTPKTSTIVRNNLAQSALYGGMIKGTGVRYCPSLEDKIVKFPDKTYHHVFIEPEGRNSDTVYPNGISNSLPEEIQDAIVRSIPGLESAEIIRFGFAIEYDFFDPTQLFPTLESKHVENLYFAGQVNGTTGYEEAAAQGFMAGVNASRKVLGKSQIVISREDGYIGVLIDDLTTKGTDEPYRMFTSRAERRLLFRQDNARYRMLPYAKEIGIVSPEFIRETEQFSIKLDAELKRLAESKHHGVPLLQMLRRPEVRYWDLPSRNSTLPEEVICEIETLSKYDGYIKREIQESDRVRRLENMPIPTDFDYWKVKHLSYEAKEKLSRVRPLNIGQASRIPGITPADINIIIILILQRL